MLLVLQQTPEESRGTPLPPSSLMGALAKLQMLLKHMQFIGLLKSIDIPFPQIYINFSSLTNLISLDPTFLQSLDQNFPVFSFRLQFFFIAVALPVLIMILTLLVFINFTTIMWMCFSVCGILLLAIRIAGALNQSFITGGDIASMKYLAVMLGTVVYCIAYRGLGKVFYRWSAQVVLTKNVLSASMLFAGGCMAGFGTLQLQIMLTASCMNLVCYIHRAQRPKWMRLMMLLTVVGACVAGWTVMDISFEGVFPDALIIPGYLIIALGSVGWLQFLMHSNSDKGVGRAFIQARKRVQRVLDKSLLALAFFFLSSAFVPVVTSCLHMFVCDRHTCPVGTKFNPYLPVDYSTPQNETLLQNKYCDSCDFMHGCNYTSATLCPAFDGERLHFHPDTSCDDRVALYYRVSAVIVLLVFGVVVPLMYFVIIQTITGQLHSFTIATFQALKKQYECLLQQYLEATKCEQCDDSHCVQRSQDMLSSQPTTMNDEETVQSPIVAMNAVDTIVDLGASVNFVQSIDSSDTDTVAREIENGTAAAGPQDSLQTPLMSPSTTSTAKRFGNRTAPPQSRRARPGSWIDFVRRFLSPKSTLEEHELNEESQHLDQQEEERRATKPERPSIDDALMKVNDTVKPKGSSLYNAYRHEFQFFLLIEILHCVVLVVVSVFVSPKHLFSAGINLGQHGLFFVVILVARPYAGRREQLLAAVISLSDTLSSGYATLLWQMPTNAIVTSEGLGFAVLVVGAVPMLLGVYWQIVDMRQSLVDPYAKQEQKEQQQRVEEAKQEILDVQEKIDRSEWLGLSKHEIVELEKKVDALRAAEPAETKLTDELDSSTKRSILQFFAVGSIPLLLIAVGLCVYATLHDPGTEFYNGSDLLIRTKDVVLADRDSWEEFVDDCCCFMSSEPMSGFNISERWACAPLISSTLHITLRTVTRNRQSMGASNGVPIRGVCHRKFALANCSVSVSDTSVVSLHCPDMELESANITTFAQRVLW
jgi:hypothetical protein